MSFVFLIYLIVIENSVLFYNTVNLSENNLKIIEFKTNIYCESVTITLKFSNKHLI